MDRSEHRAGGDQNRECPFCAIIAGEAPAKMIMEWQNAVAFVPLNPVTAGHVLVVPRLHVRDAVTSPITTGFVMQHAAEMAQKREASVNLITSVGEAATQTVMHLHVHIVPREHGDGLPLPWTPQQEALHG